MTRRLALVAWWLGALCAVVGALGAVGTLASDFVTDKGTVAAAMILAYWLPAVGLWTLCYILAGSFWRPPRKQATTSRGT